MDKKPRPNEGRVDINDVELDFEESSEDTEVELILPRKGADERGLPGAEIRDVPEVLGTQQDDWSHMGTLRGARPKWNRAGRPSGVIDEPRGMEAEASYKEEQLIKMWKCECEGDSSSTIAAVSAECAGGGRGTATEEGRSGS